MKIDYNGNVRGGAFLAVFALSLSAGAASAAENVTISTAATSNGTLSGGVFTPTGHNAVLNITDLKTALTTSNVTVTNGTMGSQTGDITVANKLSWPADTLTLDAFHSVVIRAVVKPRSTSGLTITTNDGGSGGDLVFNTGAVIFQSTSQALTINGAAYTLVADIPTLATDISGNASGNYALMADYDASSGVTFTTSPIPTDFYGTFEGLGNTISNFKLLDTTSTDEAALFRTVQTTGAVRDLTMSNVFVSNTGSNGFVAPVVGTNDGLVENISVSGQATQMHSMRVAGLVDQNTSTGTIVDCSSSASVTGSGSAQTGGLVSISTGAIANSSATGDVTDSMSLEAGGLVGKTLGGTISLSFATGNVSVNDMGGGLVGFNNGAIISQSYATGSVTGAGNAGGLVGTNQGTIFETYAEGAVSGLHVGGLVGGDSTPAGVGESYSTGAVTGVGSATIGGFIGLDVAGEVSVSYWDTTTSGITNLSQGAGNIPNDTGITGLSDTVLKSGLPSGFSGSVWGESATINGGLPYLLALPPS